MILHNLQCCHSVKNIKLTLIYFTITIFLFYNIQTLTFENSVRNSPPPYREPEQELELSESVSQQTQTGEKNESQSVTQQTQTGEKNESQSVTQTGDRLWVTMGLCWGENAQVYGKGKFPYSEAALRSIQLWHHLTEARVVITIVYTGQESPSLTEYKRQLEKFGASVRLVAATELSCVLTSQMIRILPQEHHPQIKDNDIIITADVDAFIMSSEILLPLKKQSEVSVWVWRYELSYTNGYTFMMPFIGARSKTWQEMIWYNGSLSTTVSHYKSLLNISQEAEFWDTDQDIVTYSLLANKLCSIQKSNSLWKKLNLKAEPFQDAKTCWHGSGIFEDCNNVLWQRNAMIKYYGKGCKWWHFYPYEGKKELEEKFREIMDGFANNNFLDKLISGAAVIKKNVLDKFLTVEKRFKEDPSGELEIWSDHMN